ncbi:MAG TPA: CRTAC1 family protein [Abditibacteriaceae bacterium]|jgi:hypothetical protein
MTVFTTSRRAIGFKIFKITCAALMFSGCRQQAPPTVTSTVTIAGPGPAFEDMATAAGLHFRHDYGGDKPIDTLETTGAGCCFFDYDNDGWQDIYLVNSGRVEKGRIIAAKRTPSALFHNNGDGTFSDVTQKAGVAGAGFGMGAVSADFDADGHADLFAYGYGGSTLYRNNGNGTFSDVTKKAGIGGRYEDFAATAAWADIDGDGWLDLYVGNYLKWNPQRELCRDRDVLTACSPGVYDGQPNYLYRNNGNGTFTNIAQRLGVDDPRGKAMAVIFFDDNNDGKPDLFVANDQTGNKLYLNRGTKFEDITLRSSVGYDDTGRSQASMGADCADYNHDGRFDIAFGTFQHDANTLYRNDGGSVFSLISWPAQLGVATLDRLTFGTLFLDYDNDGRSDLFFSNGHVSDNAATFQPDVTWPQPATLLRNVDGRKFADVSPSLGAAFTQPRVGRGCSRGDFNNDGWIDILVNNSGGRPFLLRNKGKAGQHQITLKLTMPGHNRDAIGARVEVVTGKQRQINEVRSGSGGYMAGNDLRLHFGLGEASRVDSILIRWPNGKRETLHDVEADSFLTIAPGRGVTTRQSPALPSQNKTPSAD